MIWYKEYSLEEINKIFDCYMTKLLEIKAIEITNNSLVCTMPITDNVRQPFGILHGGASVVLAESIGSIASYLVINPEKHLAVGLDINANHIRPGKTGTLTAYCTPIHIGRTTHVWDIKMYNDKKSLVCISRLTVAIIKNTNQKLTENN